LQRADTRAPGTPTGPVRHVVLDELSGGLVERLDSASASFLNTSGLAKASPMGMGLYRIEPVGRVGSVRTTTLQLDVRPKDRLGLSRLLFLLSYAGEQGFRPDLVAASEDGDLWSALAESLARLAERALGRGVLQGYLTVDESLRTVKGRIRISDQISRRPGMLVPLEGRPSRSVRATARDCPEMQRPPTRTRSGDRPPVWKLRNRPM
jgi:5-methylcytosine-specific restriction enzyme subunit McrC